MQIDEEVKKQTKRASKRRVAAALQFVQASGGNVQAAAANAKGERALGNPDCHNILAIDSIAATCSGLSAVDWHHCYAQS